MCCKAQQISGSYTRARNPCQRVFYVAANTYFQTLESVKKCGAIKSFDWLKGKRSE